MKKYIFILFISTACFSQTDDVLKVEYDFNLNFGQYQEFKSTLYISKSKSLFLWNKPKIKKNDGDDDNFLINLNQLDSIGAFNYTLFNKDSLFSRMVFLKKEILLLEEIIPKIKWKIFSEKKKIGNFNCQKATSSFRGRVYIAWFALDIPINSGPWKLRGLPGLILEAHDSTNEINFIASSLSKSEYKINPSMTANRVLNIEEYKKLKKNGLKDFIKILKSKLNRNLKVSITSTKEGLEIFD